MTRRTLCLDIADWWDRWMQRYGLRICVALIAGALVIGLLFVGPVTDEERQQFDAPAPSGASVPASPPPPGLQAGTPSQQEETP